MINQETEEATFNVKRAQACLDDNRFAEAVEMAEARLTCMPEDVDAKIILSQGLLRLGKLERLRELLKGIDERIGRLSLVYLRLGELCQQSGLNAEADNFLGKYNTLAAVLSPDEKQPPAEVPLESNEGNGVEPEEAGDIYPEFYTVTLADLYIRQGHLTLARKVLETILLKEPGNEQASIKLTELDKLLTVAGTAPEPETAEPALDGMNAAIVSELEGWLAKMARMRSPAS